MSTRTISVRMKKKIVNESYGTTEYNFTSFGGDSAASSRLSSLSASQIRSEVEHDAGRGR